MLQVVDQKHSSHLQTTEYFPSVNNLKRAIVISCVVQLSVIAETCNVRTQHLIVEMQEEEKNGVTCSAVATLLQTLLH